MMVDFAQQNTSTTAIPAVKKPLFHPVTSNGHSNGYANGHSHGVNGITDHSNGYHVPSGNGTSMKAL